MSISGMYKRRRRTDIIIAVLVMITVLVVPAFAAEIRGQAWNDLNADGVKDAGEPGLAGVMIWRSAPSGIDASTSTNIDGYYTFPDLPDGTYNLWQETPPGYIQTYPFSQGQLNCSVCFGTFGFHHVSVAGGEIAVNLDFGNLLLVVPSPDVTVVQQSGSENGIPIVLRPTLTTLTIRKDLSGAGDVLAVKLTLTWVDGTTKTADMAEDGTTGIWSADIPPPYPSGRARMRFDVDVDPAGPSSLDAVQLGDIMFIDPSGQVLDACSGDPIAIAIVTLFALDPATGTYIPCQAEKLPDSTSNTLLTDTDGSYSWMTASGWYYVQAEMAGYQTTQSEIVYVPPLASVRPIYLQPASGCGNIPVHPLTVTLTQVQIFLQGAKKVQLDGKFTLAADSDGIDPASDGISVRLFVPGTLPGSGQFYPQDTTIMPVMLRQSGWGWTITQPEKKRTGIREMEVQRTNIPNTLTFKLVDTKARISIQDYQNIVIQISSGNDAGMVGVSLLEKNRKYTLVSVHPFQHCANGKKSSHPVQSYDRCR